MQKLYKSLIMLAVMLTINSCTLGYSSKIAWEHETHMKWIEKQDPKIENIATVVF